MGSFYSFIHFKLSLLKADGSYSLYGYKWFSSATDSDMSLTLARVVDNQVKTTKALLLNIFGLLSVTFSILFALIP